MAAEDQPLFPRLSIDRHLSRVLVGLLVEGEANATKLELRYFIPFLKVRFLGQRELLLLKEINV